MNTNQKIARASFILIAASILGHIVSLSKEMLVAYTFGLGPSMDAYYAAISIPTVINTVLVSTFGIVFIPIFIKYKTANPGEANRASSIIINYLFIFLVAVTALLYVSAPWLIKYAFHGFKEESLAFTVGIFRVVCFSIIFSGMIGIISGVLNSFEHFGWPALTQMFVTLSTIAFILFASKSLGVLTLAYGLVVGLILQFLFLLPITMKKGYCYYNDFNWRHPAVREMASSASVLLAAFVVGQLGVLIDRIMASYLAAGSISALGYADKLVQVPLLIFSSSIATAIFPYLSSQISENRISDLKHSVETSIKMSGFIFIPLTVMLAILSRPIIQFLFQRGAFNETATKITSIVFVCYSFQFFFYTVVLIFGRVAIAFGFIKEFLLISLSTVVSKLIFNYIFMNTITPGIAGIALATAVTFGANSVLYAVIMEKKGVDLDWKGIAGVLKSLFFASVLMGAAIYFSVRLYGNTVGHVSAVTNALKIALPALAGAAVFLLAAHKLKIRELGMAIKMLKIFK